MGHEERTAVVSDRKAGVGVVDVACDLIGLIMKTGWSTGARGIRCTKGLPIDAVITGASYYPTRGEIRLYYRSAEIPYQPGRMLKTAIEMGQVDVQTVTAGDIVALIEEFRDARAAARRPGWLARLWRENEGIDAMVKVLTIVANTLRTSYRIPEPKPQAPANTVLRDNQAPKDPK